jgi:hypothetical protein
VASALQRLTPEVVMERSVDEIRRQRADILARDVELLQHQIMNLRRTLPWLRRHDASVRVQFFIAMNERRLAEKQEVGSVRVACSATEFACVS